MLRLRSSNEDGQVEALQDQLAKLYPGFYMGRKESIDNLACFKLRSATNEIERRTHHEVVL
jgi:hypothetical protein